MIVLDDADIEAAAKFAVRNSFRNSGQVCVSTERIYVDSKIACKFQEARRRVAGVVLKVGPWMKEGFDLGPMVNHRQKQWVLKQVEKAKRQGANVVLDGAGQSSSDDNFVKPTVIANVNHDMDIMCEETFGPWHASRDSIPLMKTVEFGGIGKEGGVRVAKDRRPMCGRSKVNGSSPGTSTPTPAKPSKPPGCRSRRCRRRTWRS